MQHVQDDPSLDLFSSSIKPDAGEVVTAPIRNQSESAIRKLLHPPSAVPGYAGLPTNDSRTQVTLEYVDTSINITPRVQAYDASGVAGPVEELTPAALSTFDYALLSPNGGRVFAVPFIFNSLNGYNLLTQDLANVDVNSSYDMRSLVRDATVYRPAYKSSTYMLNATAFNNTGIVTSNQFTPNLLFGGTLLNFAQKNPAEFHQFFAQELKRMPSDERFVDVKHPDFKRHAGTFDLYPVHVQDELRHRIGFPSATAVPTLDPNTSIQIVMLGRSGTTASISPEIVKTSPVPTATQIMNQSMRSYSGKATEGIFTINRLNTVAPRWLTAGKAAAGGTPFAGDDGLYRCYIAHYFVRDSYQGVVYQPLYENVPTGTVPSIGDTLLDTMWTEDMTWGWTIFQGLSVNPAGGASLQLVTKKHYLGLEAQPAPLSAWAGMSRLAPKPDIMALQATMDAFYELKDSMPARYNFLGTLGTILGPSLLKVGGSVLRYFTDKLRAGNGTSERTAPPPARASRTAPSAPRAPRQLVPVLARRPPMRTLNQRFSELTTQNRGRSQPLNNSTPRSADQQ